MSEQNGDQPDSIVLRYLRGMSTKLDALHDDVREAKQRIGQMETNIASLGVSIASVSVRLDRLDERVQRIERRLDLVVPS